MQLPYGYVDNTLFYYLDQGCPHAFDWFPITLQTVKNEITYVQASAVFNETIGNVSGASVAE